MSLQQVDTSSGQVSGVDDLSQAASSVVNWEVDDAGISRPRAGLTTHTTTGTGTSASIGLSRWKSMVVDVTADRYIRYVTDSAPTMAAAASTSDVTTQLGGTGTRATFVLGDSYIYIAGGGQIWQWSQTSGTPPAAIAASPLLVTHIATLGQRLIANNLTSPNAFVWSDIGEGAWSAWPSVNVSAADARPDPIVGLFENGSELFVFGSETLQVYSVGADPTFPFDLLGSLNVGLSAPYGVCRLDSAFVFLDDKRRIVISDGRSVDPIGDAIVKTIRAMTTVSDCWMYREERGHFSFIVVRFPTERRTFVYDLRSKKWTERSYYVAPFQSDWPVTAHAYWPRYNYQLLGTSLATGGLLRLTEDSRSDLSGPLVCERTTGWQDFGTANRKRSSRLRVVMRRGTAAQGATPGALEVRVQNDNSAWSNWQQVSVGAPEDYAQEKDIFATNGVFRRRRYGLRYSTTEDHSLVALYDDVTDLEAE